MDGVLIVKSFNVGVILSGFLFVLVIYEVIDWRVGFLLFSIGFLVMYPIMMYEERKEIERKEKEAEESRRLAEQRAAEERKQQAEEQKRRVRQREIEERESRNNPTRTSYTSSYSFSNDNNYSSISSGYNYSNVHTNDDFLNKMGNPYLSNYEKHLLVKEDIQKMVDSHLPMNSIYRNADGSVKQHDYSAFGIAANTPGIDLAEAQMFDDFI